MAPGILNKLRRRPSASSPLRQPPQSYVHHASTPPEWPTSPAQATPDVYITSPPEEDGLQTSICVHRALEHEPKRLRKQEDRASLPPPVSSSAALLSDLNEPSVEGPPVFRRTSLQAPDVVMPKKPSEIVREGAAKFLSRQAGAEKTLNLEESPAGDAAARVQFDAKPSLARVASGDGQLAPKSKATLRHRASKVLKSFTNRESLTFGSSAADKRNSQPDVRTGSYSQKRRNTLSDSSQSAFNMLAQAATAHAIPNESGAPPSSPPPTRTSGEGRRRSSTLTHVEFTPRPVSPPLPPLPTSPDVEDTPVISASAPAVMPLEPAAEIAAPATRSLPEQSSGSPKGEKVKKLQRRRSKNTFSHLFNLKSDKVRSPPPAKPAEEAVPPVPVIPQELAKAVNDPETPETSQSSTFASPSTAATPKSNKSKRFKRHRRRATVSSVSNVASDVTGTPSSRSQAETPKTPTSLRSRPFAIVDLRKGFTVRGLGKSKGKLFSAKSSPNLGSPPPPVPMTAAASESDELPETVMQRLKSRPPPLQSTESPQPSEGFPAPANEEPNASPTTVDFGSLDNNGAALPSPTESDGPVTPMFGAQEGSTPAGLALAPAIGFDEPKTAEDVPELTFTPPTSEESEQAAQRPSMASEATLLSEELFGAFDSPSTIGNLDLQLREPSTKTSTLDAHLRLDSLRFDNFSFDTNVF